mmetsp:Transcript_8834/g.25206  ORF Transcript_8834/g.25206 Transcript_8834/m.25206 type:complete len:254 (-) Transcript_8834:141-902(-)
MGHPMNTRRKLCFICHLLHNFAVLVCDKAVPVEVDGRLAPVVVPVRLSASPIGGDHGHDVGGRVALHHVLPVAEGMQLWAVGLASDCRWIQEQLCTLQRHRSGTLREPLVPADSDPNGSELCVEDLEARVPGGKVVLLFVPGPHRDVRLPVDAQPFPVRIDHANRVEEAVALPLEKRDDEDDLRLSRQLGHPVEDLAVLVSLGLRKVLLTQLLREVPEEAELRKQHDVRPEFLLRLHHSKHRVPFIVRRKVFI